MATAKRRRQAGEGTISPYKTAAGTRFLIKVMVTMPDGSKQQRLRRRNKAGQPFLTKTEAAAGIRELLTDNEKPGGWVDPTRQTVGDYLAEWLDGLRLAPSTMASYRKNVRLHLVPRIGRIKLTALTGARLSALYRQLEVNGRADGTGGLSARTVRYVGTILHKALKDAVRHGLIPVNPADTADAPSAKDARPPEMVTWTADELATFLRWSAEHADAEQRTAWVLLATTGMRRGEALALRWRDIDLDAGSVQVRRSVGTIKAKGVAQRIEEGPTKTGRARVVDLDPATCGLLRSYRRDRAALDFRLGASDALVFGDIEGKHRLPESFSRYFRESVHRCVRWQIAEAAAKGLHVVDTLPLLHLHSLRHTSATLQLGAGVHPKVVQERLGHQTISITMDTYSHALPTMQREAAATLGRLVHGI